MKPTGTLEGLMALVERLQGPQGCPWDQQQTLASSLKYLPLETQEAMEALQSGDLEAIVEEMGDVIWVWAFLAALAQKEMGLSAADFIERVEHKMIHRHPHVFGDMTLETAEEVLKNWEALKTRERALYQQRQAEAVPDERQGQLNQ